MTDVCVAKLARFHPTDRDDIAAMFERGLLDPERLVERWRFDARGEDLPRIVRDIHRLQRGVLCVEESESEIELPAWITPD